MKKLVKRSDFRVIFSLMESQKKKIITSKVDVSWSGSPNTSSDRPQTGAMMTSSNWKHFPRYWPFVRRIHRWPVNSLWRGALMFFLINCCVNTGEAGDLKRHRTHYDVIVVQICVWSAITPAYQQTQCWLKGIFKAFSVVNDFGHVVVDQTTPVKWLTIFCGT